MRVIPWITDGSVNFVIKFIERFRSRYKKLPRVLEFGMGASSLYFAFRSSELVSFEHDDAWHEKAKQTLLLNGAKNIETHRLDRPYSNRVAEIVGQRKFDIILVDGRDRMECLREVLHIGALAKDGVILIDNMERAFDKEARYAAALDMLKGAGFKIVHFEQFGTDRTGWNAPHRWLTTVAWRKGDERPKFKLGPGVVAGPLGMKHEAGRFIERMKRSIKKRL